jgi:GMP synthase (glutamine-hydrolysing)
MTRVLVVQHVPSEGPARIAALAAAAGVTLDVRHPYRGDPVPRTIDAAGARALIVLGGPMGVYEADRHPHLRDELALLRATVDAAHPVLAICLGSQLLAAALGADVRASGRQEIGFHDVALAAAAADDPLFAGVRRGFAPMSWHGDVFTLPAGAVALASSAMTPLQGFRAGPRAWGLLFHLEVEPAWIDACSTAFADELIAHAIDPAALRAQAPAACAAVADVADTVLGRWLAIAAAADRSLPA